MATYPIKMLKDEGGNPFVPLTQVDAVVGNKYITGILSAIKVLDGHYKIENENLTLNKITNQIISVAFPEITENSNTSYLKLNEEEEYIIYNEDGSEPIKINTLSQMTTFLIFDGNKYKLVTTAGTASGGGHVIVNNEGNILPQRPTLTFKGLSVNDDTATGSTVVNGPVLINNLTTTENNQGALDAYQGKILEEHSVPVGGTTGQVLTKINDDNRALRWSNIYQVQDEEPTNTNALWIDTTDNTCNTTFIVDSGSNENGAWIKFIDGTMICTKIQTVTCSITNAWGGVFWGYINEDVYLPQTFISKPVVNITNDWNDTRSFSTPLGFSMVQNNNKINDIALFKGTEDASITARLNIIAIGRWK